MACQGLGLGAITRRLNALKVPPIGPGGYWARSYVLKRLNNRAAMGEYQPHAGRAGKRRPDGPPIPGYFPVVVKEEQWHAAQAAIASRRNKGGRPAAVGVILFQGLLRCALTGGGMHRQNKGRKSGGPTLVSHLADNGAAGIKAASFPAGALERALLSRLREVDPREVLPQSDAAGRVLALSGKVADLERRVEKVKAQLEANDDLAPLVDVLRSLDGKLARANAELAQAQRE